MSWALSIGGHVDFPAETRARDEERMEALVIAEVDALLGELKSRLAGHGLNHVTFHGQIGAHKLWPKATFPG